MNISPRTAWAVIAAAVILSPVGAHDALAQQADSAVVAKCRAQIRKMNANAKLGDHSAGRIAQAQMRQCIQNGGKL